MNHKRKHTTVCSPPKVRTVYYWLCYVVVRQPVLYSSFSLSLTLPFRVACTLSLFPASCACNGARLLVLLISPCLYPISPSLCWKICFLSSLPLWFQPVSSIHASTHYWQTLSSAVNNIETNAKDQQSKNRQEWLNVVGGSSSASTLCRSILCPRPSG